MPTTFRVSVLDNTEKDNKASINVYVDPALPQSGAAGADQDSLLAALDALSIGTFGESSLNDKTLHAVGSEVRPASTLAQKETKLTVSFTDVVLNSKGSFTIPCGDLTLLTGGTESVDLAAGAGLTLKTFLDAHGRSKYGNAIVVTRIGF